MIERLFVGVHYAIIYDAIYSPNFHLFDRTALIITYRSYKFYLDIRYFSHLTYMTLSRSIYFSQTY